MSNAGIASRTITAEDAAGAAAPGPQALPAVPHVRIRLWDLPTRLFHWLLVAAVATAIVTGEIGGAWMRVHGIAGITIIGLVVFRLLWGVIGAQHARFASFVPTPSRVRAYLKGTWRGVGHNPLGALSVLALLGLLAAQAITGLVANDDIDFTGPWAAQVSDALSSKLTGWHHQLATLLFVLIGLHVLAIVFYVLVKKDKLITPMLTGDKDVAHDRLPAATHRPSWRGGALSFVVAVAFAVLAVWLANRPAVFDGKPAAPVAAPAPAPAASQAAAW